MRDVPVRSAITGRRWFSLIRQVRIDLLVLDAQHHRRASPRRGSSSSASISASDELRLVVVGTAGTEAGRDARRTCCRDAGRRSRSARGHAARVRSASSGGDAGRQRRGVDRVDEAADVGDVGDVGRVLDDQMRHCTRLSNMLCISCKMRLLSYSHEGRSTVRCRRARRRRERPRRRPRRTARRSDRPVAICSPRTGSTTPGPRASRPRSAGSTLPLSAITFDRTIPRPGKIFCIGVNYGGRNAEYRDGQEAPPKPSVFVRFPSSLVGHEQDLVRPPESEQLDYEGEIVAVIGTARTAHPRRTAPASTSPASRSATRARSATGCATPSSTSRRARTGSRPARSGRGW